MRAINLFLVWLRLPYYKIRKNKISLLTQLEWNVYLNRCNVQKYVYVGGGSVLCHCDIGAYSCISANVMIGGMEHDYKMASINPLLNDTCKYGERTYIGRDVWIGANCVIRQGVRIGDGAVIGAGSIVTHDIPENSIAYGNPARVHKRRFDEVIWNKIKALGYWTKGKTQAKKDILEIFSN